MTKTSRKWKHGDPRCDECDNGLEPDWKRCPFCDDSPREVALEKALGEVASALQSDQAHRLPFGNKSIVLRPTQIAAIDAALSHTQKGEKG